MIGQASGLGLSDEGNSVTDRYKLCECECFQQRYISSRTLLPEIETLQEKTIYRSPYLQCHSRPQRPRCFWSTPRIATSRKVQHRKSAIHGLPVTLRMLRVKPDKSDWFWSQSIVSTKPFKPEWRWMGLLDGARDAILGADQKERGLWRRECSNAGHIG